MFVIVIGFIVPESLSKKKQLLAREKWDKEQELGAQTRRSLLSTIQTANPFEPLKALSPMGPGTSPALRRNLVALALNDIIIFVISQAAGAVIILYSEYMYGWGNFESSRFVSVLSLVRVMALMGIFPIIKYFGRERFHRPSLSYWQACMASASSRVSQSGHTVYSASTNTDPIDENGEMLMCDGRKFVPSSITPPRLTMSIRP
uniref:Uncharacterized protein n=1 Tax=Fusarium oxysporum (strain Fo5176) TaxID=660025 RepID=A0A0C4DI11_FUSOF